MANEDWKANHALGAEKDTPYAEPLERIGPEFQGQMLMLSTPVHGAWLPLYGS